MNPRVTKVTPTDDYKLNIVFSNGEEAIYDCNDLLDHGVFSELRDRNYFKQSGGPKELDSSGGF
jgi:hypothetical protein